jgi:predicted phosphoribosyltransferase
MEADKAHPHAVPQIFRDRAEAGRLLAERLLPYGRDSSGLVLALPRGGVPVGYEISRALHLPLDVLITRKLGAPGNPEYAIGAVSESGHVHLNPEAWNVLAVLHAPSSFLEASVREQKTEIARRQKLYRRGRPLPDLRGRTVLLVDDGVATGATFLASIEALRALPLGRLVAALPVGPAETMREVAGRVDDLVVLLTPEPFYAVGNHYLDFTQVSDEQVTQYLTAAETSRNGASLRS